MLLYISQHVSVVLVPGSEFLYPIACGYSPGLATEVLILRAVMTETDGRGKEG